MLIGNVNQFRENNPPEPYQVAEHFFDRVFAGRTIKSVLLVNPPEADDGLFRYDTAKRGRYTNYPPYGLAVLAARLRERGIAARICNLNHAVLTDCRNSTDARQFDFTASWTRRLSRDLAFFRPGLVGVTCMFSMTHTMFKSVCNYIKSLGYPVVAGGVHISNDLERILDDVRSVDMAVVGEADNAFPDLVSVINREKSVLDLKQVTLNDLGHPLFFPEGPKPDSECISRPPALDLLDFKNFAKQGVIGAFYCFKPDDTIFATVLSNRGCRGNCTFCSVHNFNGRGIRQRSIDAVVDELEILNKQYGVGHIMWLDDDLLYNKKRAVQLFNEMVKRRLTLTWDATNGVVAAACTEEVMDAAAQSGCIAINIGMESGNPEILKKIRKPASVDTYLRAAEVLRHFPHIHTSVFLMIGFPGETLSMIMDTVNLARRMDMDWYRISQLHPLPNTPLYDAMVTQGLIHSVGNKELRFNGGAFGKQAEIEQGLRMASASFEEAFGNIHWQDVPTAEQLTDIWFYMNYHLNFHRIFQEKRPGKIQQLQAHLKCLADMIAPENGFALYFSGYLQLQEKGAIDPDLIGRLEQRLQTSAFWVDRFCAFGLSPDDLRNRNFPNRDIASPCLIHP